MSYAITLMFGATRSGRTFRDEEIKGPEYSLLIEPPLSDDEGAAQASPLSIIQLIRQGFLRIPTPPPSSPHPTTLPPSSPPPLTPSPTPLPPPSPFNMTNSVKLPVFKGVRNEDLDQFWFIAKVVWEAQGIADDQMKKATLVSGLQDNALTWYIKYCTDNPTSALADIKTALNKDFSRSKSEVQWIVGFKEIMMKLGEMKLQTQT